MCIFRIHRGQANGTKAPVLKKNRAVCVQGVSTATPPSGVNKEGGTKI